MAPQSADPRIQLVEYDPGRVIPVSVAPGYATVIDLGRDEQVESVVVGDSASWQVTASKRGDHVVVKPLGAPTTTDMVVITAARSFVFQLQVGGADSAPYVVRLRYPVPAQEAALPVLATYRFSGRRTLFPATMSDDGRHTTIRWGPNALQPAVFAVDADGKERLVNGRYRGSDYILDDFAPRFIFRLDRATATATRRPLASAR